MNRRVGCAAAALAAVLAASVAQAETTVTVARQIDTDRYDPHTSTARGTAEIMFMAGDTLVSLDYDMKTIKPGLAESWTVSDDGKIYTFKLKQGVKFCSGKAFTAADVKASIDRWLPTAADREHVISLQVGVTEPGTMAGWVAPPSTGIHQQPVDFEYVRL